MGASTPQLQLYKPGGGSTGAYTPDETADIDQINANMDKVDAFAVSTLASISSINTKNGSQDTLIAGLRTDVGTVSGGSLQSQVTTAQAAAASAQTTAGQANTTAGQANTKAQQALDATQDFSDITADVQKYYFGAIKRDTDGDGPAGRPSVTGPDETSYYEDSFGFAESYQQTISGNAEWVPVTGSMPTAVMVRTSDSLSVGNSLALIGGSSHWSPGVAIGNAPEGGSTSFGDGETGISGAVDSNGQWYLEADVSGIWLLSWTLTPAAGSGGYAGLTTAATADGIDPTNLLAGASWAAAAIALPVSGCAIVPLSKGTRIRFAARTVSGTAAVPGFSSTNYSQSWGMNFLAG